MVSTIKFTFQKLCKSGIQTDHQLNYLTLNIQNKEIRKEVENHILDQKLIVFWFAVVTATGNLALEILQFFQTRKVLTLSIGLVYWIGFAALFALFRWRFQKAIRFIPCLVFVTIAVLISATALKTRKDLSSDYDDSILFLLMFTCFFFCTLIYGQSDFKIAAFVMFPIYVAADVVITLAKKTHRDLLIDSLPPEFQNRLAPVQFSIELKGGIGLGVFILVVLYLQQVDVSLVEIKKWLIQKQQAKLNAYFMSQEDAVCLFQENKIQGQNDNSTTKITTENKKILL